MWSPRPPCVDRREWSTFYLKDNSSKKHGPNLNKLDRDAFFLKLYQSCSNNLISISTLVVIETKRQKKKIIKILISDTWRPRASIFDMWHYLAVLYKYCLNYVPMLKIGPALGNIILHTIIMFVQNCFKRCLLLMTTLVTSRPLRF